MSKIKISKLIDYLFLQNSAVRQPPDKHYHHCFFPPTSEHLNQVLHSFNLYFKNPIMLQELYMYNLKSILSKGP